MNTYPPLTISLLSQLTDRELQSNYLNHLDRTSEIASLLTQITDPGLALRIVNLASEVDLCLGASLTALIEPQLQQIIVDEIDRLEIPTRLKIDLWHRTKSKSALPYLQDIFIFNHQKPNTWEGHREIESATSTIIHIDRDLAVTLLIEELHHPLRYDRAAEILADLAPVEEIEALGDLLQTGDRRNCRAQYHSIQALVKIGTEASIAKLREVLHTCKHQWSDSEWIHGLGIIAEPAMVEHCEIGSDRAIPTLEQIIKSDAYAYYDEPEDATRSLATIGTDAAKMALIEVLVARPDLGRSIFNIFSTDGKLGIVPQLWSAHRQTYVDRALAYISEIQEREGLYNPDFSDRSYPLFAPPRPRLRHFLLGDRT